MILTILLSVLLPFLALYLLGLALAGLTLLFFGITGDPSGDASMGVFIVAVWWPLWVFNIFRAKASSILARSRK